TTAIQEDVDAVCVSSYQGGHMEYFKFLRDRLNENGGSHIKIFGGGGGTILPSEIETLQKYGITKLYHAEDGQKLGLKGIIRDAESKMEKVRESENYYQKINDKIDKGESISDIELAKCITYLEDQGEMPALKKEPATRSVVIGVTGTGGAGKSSVIDELI